jgi:transporter family protein
VYRFRHDWLWYSIATIVLWAAWALLSKAASDSIPPRDLLVIYILGNLPVALLIWGGMKFRLERNRKGLFFGVLSGVLSGTGSIAFFAALRYAQSVAVAVTVTSLYPLVTVLLAPWLLKERLTRIQWFGITTALVSIGLLSWS